MDFITTDIARSYRDVGGGICECNAAPGFRMHVAPSEGEPRDVADGAPAQKHGVEPVVVGRERDHHVDEGGQRIVIDLKVDDRRDKDATIGSKRNAVK